MFYWFLTSKLLKRLIGLVAVFSCLLAVFKQNKNSIFSGTYDQFCLYRNTHSQDPTCKLFLFNCNFIKQISLEKHLYSKMPKIQNLYSFVQILASQLVPKSKTSSKERPTKRPRKPPTETSKSGIS